MIYLSDNFCFFWPNSVLKQTKLQNPKGRFHQINLELIRISQNFSELHTSLQLLLHFSFLLPSTPALPISPLQSHFHTLPSKVTIPSHQSPVLLNPVLIINTCNICTVDLSLFHITPHFFFTVGIHDSLFPSFYLPKLSHLCWFPFNSLTSQHWSALYLNASLGRLQSHSFKCHHILMNLTFKMPVPIIIPKSQTAVSNCLL